jgi:hypothetical protein
VTLAGITAATNYFIRDATTNTFKLAATPGGAAINLTDAGGAITLTWYPDVIVSTGPIALQTLAIGYRREIAISPQSPNIGQPIGRYLYMLFEATTALTAGTLLCDLKDGFEMAGKPYNALNYVTA